MLGWFAQRDKGHCAKQLHINCPILLTRPPSNPSLTQRAIVLRPPSGDGSYIPYLSKVSDVPTSSGRL